MTIEFKRLPAGSLDLRAAEDDGMTFSGYGAAFGNLDSCGDVILKGAFKGTLRDARKNGHWPVMLEQHGAFFGPAADNTPVGLWTDFEEDDTGLKITGKLADTARGRDLYALMKMTPRPAIDGLSIGFRVKESILGTKPEEPRRTIKSVDLQEISIVTFPANDKARITSVKGFFAGMSGGDWRDIEAALRDEGLSRADATKAVSGFKSWLQRDAGEPSSDPRDEDASAEMASAMTRLAERIRA